MHVEKYRTTQVLKTESPLVFQVVRKVYLTDGVADAVVTSTQTVTMNGSDQTAQLANMSDAFDALDVDMNTQIAALA